MTPVVCFQHCASCDDLTSPHHPNAPSPENRLSTHTNKLPLPSKSAGFLPRHPLLTFQLIYLIPTFRPQTGCPCIRTSNHQSIHSSFHPSNRLVTCSSIIRFFHLPLYSVIRHSLRLVLLCSPSF